ncbi:MAG: MauE/DoxX family redox-associated membrane protein [Acidobacteriota bacterium]|nr:MauE/DoxX family redox-associated membrane protein [Acidobacteriota bacterium]
MIKLVLKVVMAAFYIFSGFNHFRDPGFYLNIMPPYLPAHDAAVVWSGVVEVVLGGLLLWPRGQWLAAWGIVAMLVAFLPVHVHMLANNHLYPETSVLLLWLRFPIQALLLAWAYWYTVVTVRNTVAT